MFSYARGAATAVGKAVGEAVGKAVGDDTPPSVHTALPAVWTDGGKTHLILTF